MTKEYRASAQLEALILRCAPSHHATPDAPDTFEKLEAWYIMHKLGLTPASLPVYDGGCDNTIYSTPAVNYAFRAWHDILHLNLDAGFDADGERRVSDFHISVAASQGLSHEDCLALYYDVWGQFVYSQHHAGQFPTNQAAFVAACFDIGLAFAVKRDF